MIKCPNCSSNSVIQLFHIDRNNRILECQSPGCFSRFHVNIILKDQHEPDSTFKKKPKKTGGRKRLDIHPCPNCSSKRFHVFKSYNYPDTNSSLKYLQCDACGTKYDVEIRFVAYQQRGPGFIMISNPESFLNMISQTVKNEFLDLLIRESNENKVPSNP